MKRIRKIHSLDNFLKVRAHGKYCQARQIGLGNYSLLTYKHTSRDFHRKKCWILANRTELKDLWTLMVQSESDEVRRMLTLSWTWPSHTLAPPYKEQQRGPCAFAFQEMEEKISAWKLTSTFCTFVSNICKEFIVCLISFQNILSQYISCIL